MRLSKTIVIVLVSFAIAGLALFTGSFFEFSYRVNPALVDAGYPARRVIGGLLFVGSTLTVFSAAPWKLRTTAWKLAIIGVPISVSGWGLYTFSILITDPLSLFPGILGAGLTVAHIYKFIDVLRDEFKTRQNVEALENVQSP